MKAELSEGEDSKDEDQIASGEESQQVSIENEDEQVTSDEVNKESEETQEQLAEGE